MSADRLQKILARAGIASRRRAEELIREGRVIVNGETATLGSKADPSVDVVKVDGRRVEAPASHHYFLLYKPRGYITTLSDPEGRRTVIDLIAPRHRRALVPVGRLDFDSEGLILLTDDGDFAHRVSHPSFGCKKGYAVKVKSEPSARDLDRLRDGIVLEGRRTAPATIERLSVSGREGARRKNTWWRVELAEGRTRQIREMFGRIGHPVQRLKRLSIGAVKDPQLGPGDYRELTGGEIAAFKGARQQALPRQTKRRRRRGPGV